MNPPKVTEEDYIDFLVATPKVCSGTEAARVTPKTETPPAHDAFTRLLHRLEPDSETLWREVEPEVVRTEGILVLDDSTLDKPYARKMELVSRHWSGKHHRVVRGINLLTVVWTDGDRHLPCDYRLYDKNTDGKTKNDHFQDLLDVVHKRGFTPHCVTFDSWYASLPNLKKIREFGWIWLTRLKANRKVNPDRTGLRAISTLEIGPQGRLVHLEGYGQIRVFKIVITNDDSEYWATNDLQMTDFDRIKYADYAWRIEEYHRGIKQFCGIERAQVRAARAQRNHIGFAIRAFVRLEVHCFTKGISWFTAKTAIIRDAVRVYLANPIYTLRSTA